MSVDIEKQLAALGKPELWGLYNDAGLSGIAWGKATKVSLYDALVAEYNSNGPAAENATVKLTTCDGLCCRAAQNILRWDKGQRWYWGNIVEIRFCPWCGKSLKITEI